MLLRSVRALVLVAALPPLAGAAAQDVARYPDWKGQWERIGDARWDIGKPRLAQDAPLTAEYAARLKASIAEQIAGGPGNDLMYKCIPPGMPRMMLGYNPLEFIVTRSLTYVALEHMGQVRRIFTDGRDWPSAIEPTYVGYSIGNWVDAHGGGRYDALEVETRGLKGPRAFDSSGLPLHDDSETIVKETIHLDAADPDILRDDITTFDHALTRPWTVTRSFRRAKAPVWVEHVCAADNHHVELNNENYFLNADGRLMPTKKDQPPPDLRYFARPAN